MTIGDTPWIKASASTNTGDCVEMRLFAGRIEIRDTKSLGRGPILSSARSAMSAWLDGAKRGEFDHPIAAGGPSDEVPRPE